MLKNSSPGMGMHKHGVCGSHGKSNNKSPKLRHYMRREAEKNERKRKASQLFASVADAFKSFKPL